MGRRRNRELPSTSAASKTSGSARPSSNSSGDSYADVVQGRHNLRRRSNENGGSTSSNLGGSQGNIDTRNNRHDRDRDHDNEKNRPSTSSGGFHGSTDTRNKPDENVSYIFYGRKTIFVVYNRTIWPF